MSGWASKRWEAFAHYIDADGAPACSKMRRSDGTPHLAPFLCDWVELRPRNHLCAYCRRLRGGHCVCGKCTAARADRKAAVARRSGVRA
jgi:hypothetical protein